MSNPEQVLNKQSKINQDHWLDEVRVFAPATVANMICGFDILGFAVDKPGDEVYMQRVGNPGVRIRSIKGDDGRLPLDPDKNTVSACVMMLLAHLGLETEIGVEIELTKHMPIGSGLGSSSASTVAGLFAINTLLGNPLTKDELMPFCVEGERLACGHGHADNVAPALMGGITLIRGISGSGPSVVAISKGFEAAQLAVDRIQEHLTANGIESLQFVSAVNAEGPKVLS